ncbi:MAG: DUF3857 domain-containing protein [Proteobacteria bacterium]|nr:DUF3857 domain-containing protein [Pseudomonadota bacterium]
MDAQRFNRLAKLAFIRTRPQTYFMIIAEKTGRTDFNNHTLAEVAVGNMRSGNASARVLDQTPDRTSHLGFQRIEAEAQMAGAGKISYFSWVCATNGWAYQLVTWGPASDRDRLKTEAAEFAGRFELSDPARRATLPGQGFTEDYSSTNYQFNIHWKDSSWRPWNSITTRFPGVTTGALHADDAALVVSAVSLFDLKPHPESVYSGMLATLGLTMDTDKAMERRAVSEKGMTGVELQIKARSDTGSEYTYRIKILQGADIAYLAGAWVESKDPRRMELLADGLGRVEFLEGKRPLPEVTGWDAQEKRVHRMALNGMGTFYFRAGQFDLSAPFFRKAVELDGTQTNTLYLSNLVQARSNAGKLVEALTELEQHPETVKAQPDLQASRAFLQGRLGQNQSAISNYALIFANGYREESHFKEYVKLLAQAQEPGQALAALEKFLGQRDTPDLRILQAALLKRLQRLKEATAILESQRLKSPFHLGIAESLADAMIQENRYSEALALSEELITQRGNLANAHYLKGRAEFGLKWYREAKESFERAAKESPTDTEIKTFLDHVSGMLGEGANSAIKEPIAPVELPAALLAPVSTEVPGGAAEFGGFYPQRITAIAYVKGKENKTTEYVRVKTLNAAGVSLFSTFQIPFNPLGEEVYVNRLEVRDAKGSLVSTGKVSDYYLLDDRSSTMATSRKMLNIPVSGLQPGHSIELVTTRRELGRADEFPLYQHNFSRVVPVRESLLFVRGDTASLQSESTPAMQPEKLPDGLLWRWKEPVVIRWEPMQTWIYQDSPTVWLNGRASRWPALATNYLMTIKDRLAPSDVVTSLTRQVTSGMTNDDQKITAVARYVQTNFVYRAVEFGRRARVPQAAATVLRDKHGDCKDHSVLVQQMLRAVGLPAHLALVSVSTPLVKNLPSLDQFDHMIVYVPTPSGGRFLDCTDKVGDLQAPVPLSLAGEEVFVLDESQPRFIPVPEYPRDASVIRTERLVSVTNRTDAVIKETLTFTGAQALLMRQSLRGQSPAVRRTMMAGWLGSQLGETLQLEEENLMQNDASFLLHLTYRVTGLFQESGGELVGQLPSVVEKAYLTPQLVDKRQTPFQLKVPLVMEGVVRISVPAGYRLRALPTPVENLENRFLSCRLTSELDKQGLRINYRLQRPVGRYAAADYAGYCQALAQASVLLGPKLSSGLSAP